MGKKVYLKRDKLRVRPEHSEVKRLFSSTKKAVKILKWKPKYSKKKGFEKGLLKTISWFSDSKNLKLYKTSIVNY